MKQRATNRPAPTPGFAIRINDETNLGIALLIAEDDSGIYWPLGPVSTIPEAREFAYLDHSRRRAVLRQGGEVCCPTRYKLWALGLEGYVVAAEFDPAKL